MAHFAEIDENNMVIRVLRVPDEQENRAQEYLSNELGLGGRWIQTSYNRRIRKNYAGPGYIYNEEYDIFIPPQPYPSWTLDIDLGTWVPPVPYPIDDNKYIWNEEDKQWILIPRP